jgi:hypothetical protein
MEDLLTVFESELKVNIEESNSLIRRGYFIDSISTKYFNNEINREGLLESPTYFLEFRHFTRQFIDANLDAIIDLEKELPKKYLVLIPELKQLKRRIESQRRWENAVVEISMSYRKEFADPLPSRYLTDSISNEKNIAYTLTNQLFKNKVRYYNIYNLNENTWDASLIRTSAVALLWKLKTIRGELNTSPADFLKNIGLNPFEEINCGEFLSEKKKHLSSRVSFIFYNNSDKEVHFNIINAEGEVLSNGSLASKSFKLEEFYIIENWFVQTLENGSCKKVYRRFTEDYLIIN